MDNSIKGICMWYRLRSESGYTLVETLVASAILMGVLIPSTLFLGKVTAQQKSGDLIVAYQLAGGEIERTTAQNLYEDGEKDVLLNNKVWRVSRQVDENQGLIVISVQVYRINKTEPIITIKALLVESTENSRE